MKAQNKSCGVLVAAAAFLIVASMPSFGQTDRLRNATTMPVTDTRKASGCISCHYGRGQSVSVRLSDGIREFVHVTIAGAGDAPIDEDSDLLRNLRLALTQFGDPALPAAKQEA